MQDNDLNHTVKTTKEISRIIVQPQPYQTCLLPLKRKLQEVLNPPKLSSKRVCGGHHSISHRDPTKLP